VTGGPHIGKQAVRLGQHACRAGRVTAHPGQRGALFVDQRLERKCTGLCNELVGGIEVGLDLAVLRLWIGAGDGGAYEVGAAERDQSALRSAQLDGRIGAVSHAGQARASRPPHAAQNFRPSRFSCPHPAHCMLESAPTP
jgi:hypothetical protein